MSKWNDEELTTLRSLYTTTSVDDVCTSLPNRSRSAIKLMASKLGLTQPKSVRWERPDCLMRLLEDTPTSWYWLGMLLADGWISDCGRLRLLQSMKDADRVYELAAYLGLSNDRVKQYTSLTNVGPSTGVVLSLRHTDIVPAIKKKLMITGSKTTNPPDFQSYRIDAAGWRSLAVGFADGDGHVAWNHPTWKRGAVSFKLHASWASNLQLLTNVLYRQIGTDMGPTCRINTNGHAHVSWTNGHVVDLLRHHIQANSLPASPRKWSL